MFPPLDGFRRERDLVTGYLHHSVFTTLARSAFPAAGPVLTGVRGVHRRIWDALGADTDRVALG